MIRMTRKVIHSSNFRFLASRKNRKATLPETKLKVKEIKALKRNPGSMDLFYYILKIFSIIRQPFNETIKF